MRLPSGLISIGTGLLPRGDGMRVHLVQFDIAWEDPVANRARVTALVERAAPAAGDLIVLPETAFTAFSFDIARTLPDARDAEAFRGSVEQQAPQHAARRRVEARRDSCVLRNGREFSAQVREVAEAMLDDRADNGRIETAILVHRDVAKADHATHPFGHG